MNPKSLAILTLAALVTATLAAPVAAQSLFETAGAEEKFTAGGFKPAPETMHTRFGTLQTE